jgi:hypothetical protein
MSEDSTARASTARLGILVVILATAVRITLLVLGLLVMVGSLSRDWSTSTVIPLFPMDESTGQIAFAIMVGLLISSAASIWGLWRRESWGWTLSIVTAGFLLALNLGWWIDGEPRYLSMLVNSIAVFYLNQRDLRATFRV